MLAQLKSMIIGKTEKNALVIDIPITYLFVTRFSTHNRQDKESSFEKNASAEKIFGNNFAIFASFGFGPDIIS